MEKLKKTILLIAGPGILLVELVVIFIHIFTTVNLKPVIVIGFLIMLIVFIPLYSVEYFRQNFSDKKKDKNIRFKKDNSRTEWEGGNIHGKVPTKTERPGRYFKS